MKAGNCPGDNKHDETTYEDAGVVDKKTMDRFKNEKFKLVGKRKLKANDKVKRNGETEPKKNNNVRPPPPGQKIKMTRLSDDLYEYRAEVDPSEISVEEDVPPESGIVSAFVTSETTEEKGRGKGNGHDRNMMVFSPDTRYEITSTPPWPKRLNGRTEIGCSGTIIYRDAVLTAGHCVYDNGYWRAATFTPGAYRTPSNSPRSPFGSWPWKYATTFSEWTRDQKRSHDIAVVKYWPNSYGYDIGNYLGWAGLRRTSSTSSYLDNCNNAGYPGDKAYPNLELWESYCGPVFVHTSERYRVDHTCDTYGGSSGSSFMDSSGWVHGINVAHYADGSANVGVLLDGSHFDTVRRWATQA